MQSGPSPASASGRRPPPDEVFNGLALSLAAFQVLDSQIERFSAAAKATHAA